METSHFSVISGRDEAMLLSAVIYASENLSNFVLISNSSEDLDFWTKHVERETGVNVTPYLLDKNAHLPVAKYFISHLDIFKDKKIKHVDLISCQVVDNINLLPFLVSLLGNNDGCHESSINISMLSELSGKIKDEIIILNNIYSDIINAKLSLFGGQSAFTPQINYSNISESEFSALTLKELKNKTNAFNNIQHSEYLYIKRILKNIRSFFQSVFLATPNTSIDIIGKTASNRYIQDGFPLIYKILSVIHFYSAKIQERLNNYNVAFLHYIRSVECFIDGYLITKKMGSFNSLDEYTTDGFTRKGAGFKFGKAGSHDQLLSQPFYVKIKELIEIRNKFYLTHGDMRVCKKITEDFSKNIIKLFKFIESSNHHINYKWGNALKLIEDYMDIKIIDFIYYSLVEKYCITEAK